MKIIHAEPFSASELLARLQQTRLRGFDGAAIYKEADLQLVPAMATDRLWPAQHYVLRPNVRRILALYEALKAFDIDIFALEGGCRVWIEAAGFDPGVAMPVIPPIAEHSPVDALGEDVWLLNDGMHRVCAARSLGRPVSVVTVSNVPEDYPYYAHPLPGGWQDVEIHDALPSGYQKKNYRHPGNHKAYFRDFNAQFPGVQEKRPVKVL